MRAIVIDSGTVRYELGCSWSLTSGALFLTTWFDTHKSELKNQKAWSSWSEYFSQYDTPVFEFT